LYGLPNISGHIFFGRSFEILSDHKPLVWLNNIKEPNMKLQRWKIKLNEYDYQIKYLPGKENYVADALFRTKIEETMYTDNSEENILEETASNADATVHSAEGDNQNYISITERPFNYFSRQIELIKGNEDTTEVTHYFHKLKIKIIYREMRETSAKEIIKEYLYTKKIAVYFHNDSDFLTFQKVEIINASHLTKY